MARLDPFASDRVPRRCQEKAVPVRQEEEPMRRYTFPIPQPSPALCSNSFSDEISADLTRILEQLCRQNQLLTDLLGAVNSLVATQLCRRL